MLFRLPIQCHEYGRTAIFHRVTQVKLDAEFSAHLD